MLSGFQRIKRCIALFLDLLPVVMQLVYGLWRLSKLTHPIITVFGGSKVQQGSIYARQATELAQKLVDHDISVLTGGGPGIMQAANCGAVRHKREGDVRSIGVGVKGLEEDLINGCAQEYITMKYFFARKWLLTQYSVGFAVFPGGFGTLDELAEIATLMQTNKLPPVPIVLIGVDYWRPFMTWVHESALKNNMLKKIDVNLLMVTDDIEEAFNILYAQGVKKKEESPTKLP